MNLVLRKSLLVCGLLTPCSFLASGCTGGIVPFSGTAPQAAINLDGTYVVTISNADVQPSTDPQTLVIANGLLTSVGAQAVTPVSIDVTGDRFVWKSGTTMQPSGFPFPVDVLLTLDVTRQADGSLVGTLVLTALDQPSAPANVTLVKQ